MNIRAFIFDLDGVIVETAHYHFKAWKKIAYKVNGYKLTQADNNLLKGVSRINSLDIILDLAGATISQEQKDTFLVEKNQDYLDSIKALKQSDLLPGALNFLKASQEAGIKIGLGSASKNARFVLEASGIIQMFEAILDGTNTTKGKPHPEVIQAANTGGFHSVGINVETDLTAFNLNSFENITPMQVIARIEKDSA